MVQQFPKSNRWLTAFVAMAMMFVWYSHSQAEQNNDLDDIDIEALLNEFEETPSNEDQQETTILADDILEDLESSLQEEELINEPIVTDSPLNLQEELRDIEEAIDAWTLDLEDEIIDLDSIDLTDEELWSDESWDQKYLSDVDGEPIEEEVVVEESEAGEWFALDKASEVDESERKQYRLRIGDQLLISIYGEGGTQRTVFVDPTGSVSYLFVNSVYALGLTINELRDVLETRLKEHFLNSVVSITPVAFTADYVTVMGEVKGPGIQVAKPSSTVLSAMCEAGGLNLRNFRGGMTDMADLDLAFLARNNDYVPIDFQKLIREGDLTQDVKVEGGDFIYIPSVENKQIFVLGEVYDPLTIDAIETITIAGAIAEAGGVTERASSRAVVLRGSLCCPVKYLVDINLIFKGYTCDFELQPGDIVYVPARTFTTLRETFHAAVRSFVSIIASSAATKAYLDVHPHANATGVVAPIPVIGGGGGVVVVE